MERHEVEKKYQDYGCSNYKLRNKTDLKGIIGLDLESAEGWNELSVENKALLEKGVLGYLNGCGLMYREGYRIKKAYLCQIQELIYDDKEAGYRRRIGYMALNVNNADTIKVELLDVSEEFKELKNSSQWEIETCNGQNTFLRMDLTDKEGRAEWFHVYTKDGEVEFY